MRHVVGGGKLSTPPAPQGNASGLPVSGPFIRAWFPSSSAVLPDTGMGNKCPSPPNPTAQLIPPGLGAPVTDQLSGGPNPWKKGALGVCLHSSSVDAVGALKGFRLPSPR